MRVRWSPEAATDLEQINDYLNERDPRLAHSTVLEIYETIRNLKSLPYRGRIGAVEGTRELILTRLPFVIVYRIKYDETIEVLHIFHGAQDKP
ncbi:MAG TPA: type II toxin-antitoxin system RelE/ParE family toxin [Candidatus Angelobacter sp.]|jgi:addiction module RelE/StbE family toxin|nr:type II toxin-antitoxin system RelE/ParE family toxin [Candidatus Angelobacter sp.]